MLFAHLLWNILFVVASVRGLSKFCWFVGTLWRDNSWIINSQTGLMHHNIKTIHYFLHIHGDVNLWERATLEIHEHLSPVHNHDSTVSPNERNLVIFYIIIIHLSHINNYEYL